MTIVTVGFDFPNEKTYATLMKVFEYSVRKNFPEANFVKYVLEPNNDWYKETFKRGFYSNRIKFNKWVSVLNTIKDDNIILMDCDMLVLKPLDSIFCEDFDIGVTYRTKVKLPYNGGVIFVKNNPISRKFFLLWRDIDEQMYANKKFAEPWRTKYAGLNQASFGYLIENPQLYDCNIKKFPCSIWNECGENRYNENMKCIHIKSAIRRACFSSTSTEAIEFERRGHVQVWREHFVQAGVNDVDIIRRPIKDIKARPLRRIHV